MAALISSFVTVTIRAAPEQIISKASFIGARAATPSAIVMACSVVIIFPASKEWAKVGATSDTTPIVSVVRPNSPSLDQIADTGTHVG